MASRSRWLLTIFAAPTTVFPAGTMTDCGLGDSKGPVRTSASTRWTPTASVSRSCPTSSRPRCMTGLPATVSKLPRQISARGTRTTDTSTFPCRGITRRCTMGSRLRLRRIFPLTCVHPIPMPCWKDRTARLRMPATLATVATPGSEPVGASRVASSSGQPYRVVDRQHPRRNQQHLVCFRNAVRPKRNRCRSAHGHRNQYKPRHPSGNLLGGAWTEQNAHWIDEQHEGPPLGRCAELVQCVLHDSSPELAFLWK